MPAEQLDDSLADAQAQAEQRLVSHWPAVESLAFRIMIDRGIRGRVAHVIIEEALTTGPRWVVARPSCSPVHCAPVGRRRTGHRGCGAATRLPRIRTDRTQRGGISTAWGTTGRRQRDPRHLAIARAAGATWSTTHGHWWTDGSLWLRCKRPFSASMCLRLAPDDTSWVWEVPRVPLEARWLADRIVYLVEKAGEAVWDAIIGDQLSPSTFGPVLPVVSLDGHRFAVQESWVMVARRWARPDRWRVCQGSLLGFRGGLLVAALPSRNTDPWSVSASEGDFDPAGDCWGILATDQEPGVPRGTVELESGG